VGGARRLPRRRARSARQQRIGALAPTIALGRKNYLVVGDVEAGKSLAGLYSLVATCESRGINPFDYLADVLGRVQDDPAKAIDELLPGAWTAAG